MWDAKIDDAVELIVQSARLPAPSRPVPADPPFMGLPGAGDAALWLRLTMRGALPPNGGMGGASRLAELRCQLRGGASAFPRRARRHGLRPPS
jgi:hypothetical protein